MPYKLVIGSTAKRQLSEMPSDVRSAVVDKLLDISEKAEDMLRPAVFPPYPPGYLVHDFFVKTIDNDDDLQWFVVIIVKKSDEGTEFQVYSLSFRTFP